MSTTLAMWVSLVSITKYCNALCADSESLGTGRARFASSTTMQVALPLPFKSLIRLNRVLSLSLLDNLSIRAVMAEDIGVEAAAATLSAFATFLADCSRFEAQSLFFLQPFLISRWRVLDSGAPSCSRQQSSLWRLPRFPFRRLSNCVSEFCQGSCRQVLEWIHSRAWHLSAPS